MTAWRLPSLGAGPALAAFGRQMARRAAWTRYSRWATGWLAPLLAPLQPLRAGPLLGASLTQLASVDEQPAARSDPAARPKGLAPAHPPDLPPHLRPSSASAAVSAWPRPWPPLPVIAKAIHPTPEAPVEAVAQLAQQASVALLTALAGGALGSAAARTKTPRQARLAPDAVPAQAQTWRGARADASARPARGTNGMADETRGRLSAPLADAGALRLDGPTVPLLTLRRLAGLAPTVSQGDHSRTPPAARLAPDQARTPRSAVAKEESLALRPAVNVALPNETRPTRAAPFVTEDGAAFTPPLWSMLDVAAPPPAPWSGPAVERETTFSVVNPTLAPRLPFLTPDPEGPVDLPIAAATARQGALAEASEEEDLEALAAKLKRILNDEARRHGIQV